MGVGSRRGVYLDLVTLKNFCRRFARDCFRSSDSLVVKLPAVFSYNIASKSINSFAWEISLGEDPGDDGIPGSFVPPRAINAAVLIEIIYEGKSREEGPSGPGFLGEVGDVGWGCLGKLDWGFTGR